MDTFYIFHYIPIWLPNIWYTKHLEAILESKGPVQLSLHITEIDYTLITFLHIVKTGLVPVIGI